MVKKSDRTGISNDIHRDMQKSCITNHAPNFYDYINLRDKSKDIYYFNDVEFSGEQIGNLPPQKVIQPYSHRTYYVETMFPFIARDTVAV